MSDDRGKGEKGRAGGVMDFGSTWPKKDPRVWKKKQLRRAQPGGVLKGQSSNEIATKGREVTSIRTRGESTKNTPTGKESGLTTTNLTNMEDKLPGVMDSIPSTIVVPPRTDPLHRRTQGTNEKIDEQKEDEVGVASGDHHPIGYASLTPVRHGSKSKGRDLEEPDGLGLSSYISQMRARGHKRSTSAPLRARLKTTPTNGGVSLADHVMKKQLVVESKEIVEVS